MICTHEVVMAVHKARREPPFNSYVTSYLQG